MNAAQPGDLNNNKFDVMKHQVQSKPAFISNVLRKDFQSGPPKVENYFYKQNEAGSKEEPQIRGGAGKA